MGSRIVIRTRRGGRRSAPAPAPAPRPIARTVVPKVETRETKLGIEVKVDSNDEVLRELALQRVQKTKELELEKELRGARRTSARKSADLQRRAQAIQIEQRGANVGREVSRIKRETRIARAGVLSKASTADVTRTSAFKASQIALRSAGQRETGRVKADEARNVRLDQIRSEEISSNLEARIAENPDPINVFLDPTTATTTASSGTSATTTRTGGRTIIRSRITGSI